MDRPTQHNHSRDGSCGEACPVGRWQRESTTAVGNVALPDVVVSGTLGSGWERPGERAVWIGVDQP